jgi:predicted transcriptional regulator
MQNDVVTDLTMQVATLLGVSKRLASNYHLRDMKQCLDDVDKFEETIQTMEKYFQSVKEEILNNLPAHIE